MTETRNSILALLTFALLTQPDFLNAADDARQKPNIVILLADDSGWGDYGITGNTNIKTPVLDAFARSGAVLDRFYVCPVCAPTRAEFLTAVERAQRYIRAGDIYQVNLSQP